MIPERVLEDARIGIAHSRWPLTGDAALVGQAEATAEEAPAGEGTLQQPGDRCCDRLAYRHAGDVGEHAVRKALELEPARGCEADERVLRAAEGIRERALRGGRRVVALGDVVLEEPRGAVGPRLARAERAVVRVYRVAIGR